MPYREKTAWLTLIAIAVTFGPYFTVVASRTRAGAVPEIRELELFALTVIAQVAVMIAGYAFLAITAPKEVRTPPDERDRAITSRSITYAYYVLIAGMIVVACLMPFNAAGWKTVNAALATIVLAELVHYGVIVLSYRRQA